MANVELKGLPQLLAKLDMLKYDAKYRGGRFALRKAAQVVSRQVKQNAQRIDDPQTRASIAKNVAERWNQRLYKSTGDLGFRVGILGGAGGNKTSVQLSANPGGDTRHWRYKEFGTEKMRAEPFMRPAGEQSAQHAANEFIVQFNKAVSRTIAKNAKAPK